MSYDKRQPLYYGKGALEMEIFSPSTHDLVYWSNKLQSGNLETTMNAGEIFGGIGNALAIAIPDGQQFNLTITAADLSLDAASLNVGQPIKYGGLIRLREPSAPVSGVITLLGNAVPHLGNNTGTSFAWVHGKAYPVDPNTRELVGFVADNDDPICVEYWIQSETAQQLDINTSFSPMIGIAYLYQPLYTTETSDLDQGSRAGTDIICIPRFQLNGDISRAIDQATASTTVLSGRALSYDEGIAAGSVCETSIGKLGYIVRELYGKDLYAMVTGLAVVGSLSLAEGANMQIPLKLVMQNGSLTQPTFSDFDFAIDDTSTATISLTGLISGLQAGTTTITITHKTIARLITDATITVVA